MSDYPLPRHAAYIWQAGDKIFLGLPPRSGDLHGHTLTFPATERGLEAILQTLAERARLPESFIGSRAEPTQHQLDAILRELRKPRQEAEDMLKDLGL